MAWNDDKSLTGASVTGSEWNTMVDVIEAKVNGNASVSNGVAYSNGLALTSDADFTFDGDKVYAKSSRTNLVSDTDGATITFNMNNGNIHTVTLTANRTLAVSNVAVGQSFTLILVQDNTGSHTVTWFNTIKWAGGSAPTLTTTGNKTDVLTFICVSTDNYLGFIAGQNL